MPLLPVKVSFAWPVRGVCCCVLQVQRLRDVLAMHANDVYTLESRKVQLKLSLDERRHEIEVHRDGLKAELKLVRDDIHR